MPETGCALSNKVHPTMYTVDTKYTVDKFKVLLIIVFPLIGII